MIGIIVSIIGLSCHLLQVFLYYIVEGFMLSVLREIQEDLSIKLETRVHGNRACNVEDKRAQVLETYSPVIYLNQISFTRFHLY